MNRRFIVVLALLLACVPSFGSHTPPRVSNQFHVKRGHLTRNIINEKFLNLHQRTRPSFAAKPVANSALKPTGAKKAQFARPKRNSSSPANAFSLVSAVQIPMLGEDDDETEVVMGDFNGDGKPDAAKIVSNSETYSISVLLSNGDGTFQAAQLTSTPSNSDDPIVVGDVNGDGKDDIVMVHPGAEPPSFDVMISNGDGTFTLGNNYVISEAPLAGGILIDTNGDGKLDALVVDNSNPGHVIVALGNGDGTFQNPTTYATLSTAAPGGLDFADFNGDGKIDFAGIPESGQVQVFLSSDGGYAAPASLTTSDANYDICNLATGDLSGDGKPEIVAEGCEHNTITVFVNNGDGSFQTGFYYNNAGDVYMDPYGITIADVNGDGKNDIVVANSDSGMLTVFLGNGDGTVAVLPQAYDTGGYSWNPPLIADFNGDGLADVIEPDDWFSLVYMEGYGDGTFRAAPNYFLPNSFTQESYSASVASGDFNGDGIADLVVGQWGNANSPGVVVYLSNGDGTLRPGVNYGTSTSLGYVTVADFNGDGKLDIAATDTQAGVVQIFLGNGDGTFSPGQSFPTDNLESPYPQTSVAGDFNHDGKMDLAIANGDGNIGVLLGNGDGTFGAVTCYPLEAYAYDVVAADLNGDGYLDLGVSIAGDGSAVAILLGNTDNSGTFQAPVTLGVDGLAEEVAFGDLNNDGKLDMAVTVSEASTYPGEVEIFLGNGDGTFQAGTIYPSSSQFSGLAEAYPGSLRMYDFNGDNNLDLAYINSDFGTVAVAFGNGDGTIAAPVEFPTSEYNWGMVLADVNDDGAMDVITANDEVGGVSVQLNGTGTGTAPNFSLGTQISVATAAPGSSASYVLNLTGRNGYSGTITFSCSGLPAGATCSFSPSSVVAQGNNAITTTLSISTTAATAELVQPVRPNSKPGEGMLLASLSGMGLFGMLLLGSGNRSRKAHILTGLMLLLMLCTLVGCSGTSTGKGATGTPAGSYNVAVTSTGTGSGAPTHTLNLTLVVQ